MIADRLAEHPDHDVVAMNGFSRLTGEIGALVCLTCKELLGPLPVCGQPTKMKRPCRAPIRVDLGHEACRIHA
jgi:hypothetical protein